MENTEDVYILSTINGLIFPIITEQVIAINFELKRGTKMLNIGSSLVASHQICSIVPVPTFLRNDRMALAVKRLKRCKKCYTVIALSDTCPCKDKQMRGEFSPFLEMARQDNPKLDKALKQQEKMASLPQPQDKNSEP